MSEEILGANVGNRRKGGLLGCNDIDDSLLFFFLILVILFTNDNFCDFDDDSLLFFFLLLVIIFSGGIRF